MKISALALAVTAALAANSAKALLIDDFTTGHLGFPGVYADGPSGHDSKSQSGTMLGGQRLIDLQMLTGTGTSVVTVPSAISALNIDNGVNERSNVKVTWNTTAVDLTSSHIALGLFLTVPSPIDHPMNVTFTVTSATGTSIGTHLFPTGSMGKDFFIPFANFTGSANFEQATQVTLALTSPEAALDTQVTLVDNGVPIPGTLVLMGAGLASLARSIKRASRG